MFSAVHEAIPALLSEWDRDVHYHSEHLDCPVTGRAKRAAERAAGRACAARALGKAGLTPEQEAAAALQLAEPPNAAERAPLWPVGWVGSITHTRGKVGAAVAPATRFRGLGIDTEPVMQAETADRIASRVADADELARAEAQLQSDRVAALTLLFSAKEAIFKCLAPTVGGFFGFDAVRIESVVTAGPTHGSFEFVTTRSLCTEVPQGWTGQGLFRIESEWVHTATAWRRDDQRRAG